MSESDVVEFGHSNTSEMVTSYKQQKALSTTATKKCWCCYNRCHYEYDINITLLIKCPLLCNHHECAIKYWCSYINKWNLICYPVTKLEAKFPN